MVSCCRFLGNYRSNGKDLNTFKIKSLFLNRHDGMQGN
jgi:hypothetical protein